MKVLALFLALSAFAISPAIAQTLVAQGFTGARAMVRMGDHLVVADASGLWRVHVASRQRSLWVPSRRAEWRALAADGILLYAADAGAEQIVAFNRAGEQVVVRDGVRATALAVDRTGALFWLDDEGELRGMSSTRHHVFPLRVAHRFAPETTLTFDGQMLHLAESTTRWTRSPVGELRSETLAFAPIRHLAARGNMLWLLGAGWVAVVHPEGHARLNVPESAVYLVPGTALDFFLLTPDALWHWPAPALSR